MQIMTFFSEHHTSNSAFDSIFLVSVSTPCNILCHADCVLSLLAPRWQPYSTTWADKFLNLRKISRMDCLRCCRWCWCISRYGIPACPKALHTSCPHPASPTSLRPVMLAASLWLCAPWAALSLRVEHTFICISFSLNVVGDFCRQYVIQRHLVSIPAKSLDTVNWGYSFHGLKDVLMKQLFKMNLKLHCVPSQIFIWKHAANKCSAYLRTRSKKKTAPEWRSIMKLVWKYLKCKTVLMFISMEETEKWRNPFYEQVCPKPWIVVYVILLCSLQIALK